MHRIALATLVLSASLVAQAVAPPHFAAAEATANNTYPFGGNFSTSTPFRYAQVHDDVPAMVIQGFAFRHDSVFVGPVVAPYTLTLDAWMSTAAPGITSQSASSVFDNNHGADKIQVVTNKTISVGANDPAAVPGPFVLDIPFDTGVVFPYAAGGSSLVWEVHITARTNTESVAFDAVSSLNNEPANPPMGMSMAHTGCRATGKINPMWLMPTPAQMSWSSGQGAISMQAGDLLNNGLIAWVFGLDDTQWSGVPLPFDVPGSTGAPSGTCTLRTDLGLLFAATASPGGNAQLALTFPVTPAMHGATLYSQVLGVDPQANPLGFTLSNLAVLQLVAPYPTPLTGCRIYQPGSLAASGVVETITFLVTRFY
jgi:hypothetical protein